MCVFRCVTGWTDGWTDWDFFGVFTVFIVFMVTIAISKHEYARAVIISVLKLQLQIKAEANLIQKIACITHFIKSVSSWIQ